MTSDWHSVLTLVGAVGCGLMAGVFFAFSTFVMKALSRIPAAQGIAAMQSINVVAINPWFMTAFLGTGVVCVALAVASILTWVQPAAMFELSGSLSYLLGTFVVTVVFNVPRNNALAAINPASDDGTRLWAGYLRRWTAWNHVRTAAALLAMVLLILALSS